MTGQEAEDLGTLVSEKITWAGFITAMFESMFMGMYLFATLAAAFGMARTEPWISAMLLGLALVLFEKFLRTYMRITHPMDNYQTVQVFKKDEGDLGITTRTRIIG